MSTYFQLADILLDPKRRYERMIELPPTGRRTTPQSALLLNPVAQLEADSQDRFSLNSMPKAANDDHPPAPPLVRFG